MVVADLQSAGLNAAYTPLIVELLKQTDELRPTSEAFIVDGRRALFEHAIKGGADLRPLPAQIASLDEKGLEAAAKKLPVMQRPDGEDGKLQDYDREEFASAGKRRKELDRHDNLFGPENDTVVFDLRPGTGAFLTKVTAYLAEHNNAVPEALALTQAEDAARVLADPKAYPLAGRALAERELRLDPGKPGYTQYQDATKPEQGWRPAQKLGRLLQDDYRWDLLRELELQEPEMLRDAKPVESPPPTLLDIAHHEPVSADALMDAELLRVVVSRDAQTIGAMSTGKRWTSCMSPDGKNFSLVPREIEAGSVVAFAVHKDDPEAHYPLMRLLLKPFRNEAGDTVLIPAKVYGDDASGNARASEAFSLKMRDVAADLATGKAGFFTIDRDVYEDGLPKQVKLQGAWTREEIATGLRGFQDSTLREGLTELLGARETLGKSGKKPDREAKAILETQTDLLTRVFISNDPVNGLSRVYFKELQGSNIGTHQPSLRTHPFSCPPEG